MFLSRWDRPSVLLEGILLVITPVGIYKMLRFYGVDKSLAGAITAFWTLSFYLFMKYIFVTLGALFLFLLAIIIYKAARKVPTKVKTVLMR